MSIERLPSPVASPVGIDNNFATTPIVPGQQVQYLWIQLEELEDQMILYQLLDLLILCQEAQFYLLQTQHLLHQKGQHLVLWGDEVYGRFPLGTAGPEYLYDDDGNPIMEPQFKTRIDPNIGITPRPNPIITDPVIEPAPTTPAAVATDVGAVPDTTMPMGAIDPVLLQQATAETLTDPLIRSLYFGTADSPGFFQQLQQAGANL